jgi:hypothetical protein
MLMRKASGPLGVREVQRELVRLNQSVIGVARETNCC